MSITKLKKNFQKVQIRYCEFGAHDSEPRDVFYSILGDAIDKIPFKDLDADGWELFSNRKGREDVAKHLNKSARIAHQYLIELVKG